MLEKQGKISHLISIVRDLLSDKQEREDVIDKLIAIIEET